MKKIRNILLIIAIFALLVLPSTAYAATVFQEIDVYTRFHTSVEGSWRNYEYADLGFNESFTYDYDSPLFDVILQKRGFLGITSTVGSYTNCETNKNVRYCYRWKNANEGKEYRYKFTAHSFNNGYRYYVYDTITLVSEQ